MINTMRQKKQILFVIESLGCGGAEKRYSYHLNMLALL